MNKMLLHNSTLGRLFYSDIRRVGRKIGCGMKIALMKSAESGVRPAADNEEAEHFCCVL